MLSRQQFASVTDLGEFRARRMSRRALQEEMPLSELRDHVQHEHGVPTSSSPSRDYLEYMHGDLHQSGPDAHAPWVEHDHR